jgi:hypothetical protein
MNEQLVTLHRRAAACRGFRLMKGMQGWARVTRLSYERWDRMTVLWAPGGVNGVHIAWAGVGPTLCVVDGEHLIIDYTAPSTVGCMLELIADACGADHAALAPQGNIPTEQWMVTTYSLGSHAEDVGPAADTRREALAAALEAAP